MVAIIFSPTVIYLSRVVLIEYCFEDVFALEKVDSDDLKKKNVILDLSRSIFFFLLMKGPFSSTALVIRTFYVKYCSLLGQN